ncbi:MAG: hypothetical protein Q7U74_14470, partial [Saprospiraceae bacterium]|nr:hypothetical protein [Saprospiraceae bacterium]
CLFVENILLTLAYSTVFIFFYAGTVKKEEALLSGLFGKEYTAYTKAVPAFIPRLTPYRSKEKVSYSLAQAHYNGEFIRVLVTGILLCLLYVFYYYYKERMLSNNDLWQVGLLTASQTAVLLLTIAHRRNIVKKEQQPSGEA